MENRNVVLRFYYAIPFLFGYCCIGAELFYVLLYVTHFFPHPFLHQVSPACHYFFLYCCVLFVFFLLPCSVDQVCFYGCLPGCAIKQVVNVAQLCSAAHSLASRDPATSKKIE